MYDRTVLNPQLGCVHDAGRGIEALDGRKVLEGKGRGRGWGEVG